jgi:cysteine dioxygenase
MLNKQRNSTAHCEHAEALSMLPAALPEQPEHLLNRIAYRSAAYTSFHELVHILREKIQPIDMHTDEHIESIKALLRDVRFDSKEWQQYTSFMDGRYTRNLVGYDENFTVFLMGWSKTQASPIHDHAQSSCWVKCLYGALQEERFRAGADGLELISVMRANVDDVTYINDSQGLHRMSNTSAEDVCVTLHIYSPPYQFCNAFEMYGGKRQICMLAANAPYETFFDAEQGESGADLSNVGPQLEKLGPQPGDPEALVEWQRSVYDALSHVVVSREDWKRFTHFSAQRYTRSLVYSDENFSVLLLCWMPGQGTPKHTHGRGTNSWFRVLTGEIEVTLFGENDLPSVTTVNSASPAFFEGEGLVLHTTRNASPAIAVSLHIYSPPYKQLTYAIEGSSVATLPIVHSRGEKLCGCSDKPAPTSPMKSP